MQRRGVAASDDTWRIEMNCAFPGPTAMRCCSMIFAAYSSFFPNYRTASRYVTVSVHVHNPATAAFFMTLDADVYSQPPFDSLRSRA